jgi:hypothetical protein
MLREEMSQDGYGDRPVREDGSDAYHVKLYRTRLYREPPRTWEEKGEVEDDPSPPDSCRLRRSHRRWW